MADWQVGWYPPIALFSTPAAGVAFSTVKRHAEACNIQQYYDYRPWWGNYGVVFPFRSEAEVPSHYWRCKYMKANVDTYPPQSSTTSSYHTFQWNGSQRRPLGIVTVPDDRPYPVNDAAAPSHEILEMMGNPWPGGGGGITNQLSRQIWSPDGCEYWLNPQCQRAGTSKWVTGLYMNEICDPVYNWGYWETISSANGGGMCWVSDFITPHWWNYSSAWGQRGIRYDALNRLRNSHSFSWWGVDGSYWLQAGGALPGGY